MASIPRKVTGGKYSMKPGDNLDHSEVYSGRNKIVIVVCENRHSVSAGGEVSGSIIQSPIWRNTQGFPIFRRELSIISRVLGVCFDGPACSSLRGHQVLFSKDEVAAEAE